MIKQKADFPVVTSRHCRMVDEIIMFSVYVEKLQEMLQCWCRLAVSSTTWRLWREKPGWSPSAERRVAGTHLNM